MIEYQRMRSFQRDPQSLLTDWVSSNVLSYHVQPRGSPPKKRERDEAQTRMRSISGAQPEELENKMVLFPALSRTGILNTCSVSQFPSLVLVNLYDVAFAPLTLIAAIL